MNAGCAGKAVRSLKNACHTWAPRRCVYNKVLYKSVFTLHYLTLCVWRSEHETAIVELEKRQLLEKQQLEEMQLKEKFILQRQLLMTRQTKVSQLSATEWMNKWFIACSSSILYCFHCATLCMVHSKQCLHRSLLYTRCAVNTSVNALWGQSELIVFNAFHAYNGWQCIS